MADNPNSTRLRVSLQQLNDWYTTSAGHKLQQQLATALQPELKKCPAGWLAIGTSCLLRKSAESASPVHALPDDIAAQFLTTEGSMLPFKADSQAAIALLHGLDLTVNISGLLRESTRMLSMDGQLLIVGFNPNSLLGCWRWGRQLLQRPDNILPWSLNFYSRKRLCDALDLLGYRIEKFRSLHYQPLLSRQDTSVSLSWIEKSAQTLLPYWGNVYIILAQKTALPLTPLRFQWQPAKQTLLQSDAIQPSSFSGKQLHD